MLERERYIYKKLKAQREHNTCERILVKNQCHIAQKNYVCKIILIIYRNITSQDRIEMKLANTKILWNTKYNK